MILRHEIESVKDFETLRPKWVELQCGNDMTVFQTYEWNILIFQQYKNSIYNSLFSRVVVYETDTVIAPLIIQKVGCRFRWVGRPKGIFFLGEGSYADYLNLVYRNTTKEQLVSLINHIVSECKLSWEFSFIRDGTLLNQIFKEYIVDPVHETVSIEVILPKSIDDYDKMLSKSTRQNLRTSLNRIRRDSLAYELKVIEGVVDGRQADELVPIHLKRVLEINSHSTGLVNGASNWLRRQVLRHNETRNNIVNKSMKALPNSVLVLCKLNDSVAGYLYGLRENNVIRVLQNCFVDEYKFYSPMFRGSYDFIVEKIKSSQICCIDFTRGNEEYKYKLGGSEVSLFTYIVVDGLRLR